MLLVPRRCGGWRIQFYVVGARHDAVTRVWASEIQEPTGFRVQLSHTSREVKAWECGKLGGRREPTHHVLETSFRGRRTRSCHNILHDSLRLFLRSANPRGGFMSPRPGLEPPARCRLIVAFVLTTAAECTELSQISTTHNHTYNFVVVQSKFNLCRLFF